MTQVYTNTELPSFLHPIKVQCFRLDLYTPSTPVYYTSNCFVAFGADQIATNDTLPFISVDDSIYARDDGSVTGSLEIGLGMAVTLDNNIKCECWQSKFHHWYATRVIRVKNACGDWDMVQEFQMQLLLLLIQPLSDDSARVYTIQCIMVQSHCTWNVAVTGSGI